MRKDWEENALNILPKAIESVMTSLRPLLLEKLQSVSARLESLNAINNIGEEANASSETKENVKVLTRFNNPFTPSQINKEETTSPQPVIYSGPSAFNDNPNNLYNFIERGGYSGTFILLAGVILMIITFLVTFMVLTYLKI